VTSEADLAVRVVVARPLAELVGAVLMGRLGSFAEEEVEDPGAVVLTFYPKRGEETADEELLALIPAALRNAGRVRIERRSVLRDWVDGWKDHFHPIVIGRIRVLPPWEASLAPEPRDAGLEAHRLIEVVINPGLGFGTGLHPTTRGTLAMLQADEGAGRAGLGAKGSLVDAGTGSGILAVAAAKLGWEPVLAFDNDPFSLQSALENVAANKVADKVRVCEARVEEASLAWFSGATVLANMTLEPVLVLVRRLGLAGPGRASGRSRRALPPTRTGLPARTGLPSRTTAHSRPGRLVVSGILSGGQEEELVSEAERCGFRPGRRLYEAEWATIELLPLGED
jgi:ribosomal protein L11 methyltransferase